MPPLLDWLSWEFWTKTANAVFTRIIGAIERLWAQYAANRENIVSLVTLIGGGIGIHFLAIRTRAIDRTAQAALEQAKTAAYQSEIASKRHEEQSRADLERRIAENFAKAVEQLGSDKRVTRLGAIYTLVRISQESEREYWPIMETLTAYVREHAPQEIGRGTPDTDIQAILTALGHRDRDKLERSGDNQAGRYLNLAATHLCGADLQEACFKGDNFIRANLCGANLNGANFRGAYLGGANLSSTYLVEADFTGADL